VPSDRNLFLIKKYGKYGKMWKNKEKPGKFVNGSC
jgi:hypothetical protein